MIRKLVTLFVLSLAVSTAAFAQEGQLMLVYDEVVRPDHLAEYVAGSQEFMKMLAENLEDARWSTIMTDDFHFLYAIPIQSFGDIPAMHQDMMKMAETVGEEKFRTLMESAADTTVSVDSMIVMRRDDLSHYPATIVKPEETRVISYNFYKVKPGMEMAAEDVAREYAALMKEKEVEHGYSVYQLLVGPDMPALVVATPATSREHLAEIEAAMQQKLGAEGAAMQRRAFEVVRGFDVKIGQVRPDLSSTAFRQKQ